MEKTTIKVYPGVNLKKTIIIFYLFLLFTISLVTFFFAYIVPNIWVKILLFFISIFLLLVIVDSFTTKVLVDNEKVIKKSIFGIKSIKFLDIKKFGVFVQGYGSAWYITKDNYNKKFWFGTKVIYLSNRKDYDPIFSFKQKGSIKFHYFKDLFNEIEIEIKSCNSIDSFTRLTTD